MAPELHANDLMFKAFLPSLILLLAVFLGGCPSPREKVITLTPPSPGRAPADPTEEEPSTFPVEPLEGGGGIDSGGGDPLANQFTQIIRFFLLTQSQNPIEGVDLDTEKASEQLQKLSASLEGEAPLVIFPEGQTVDCIGSPKLGCFKDQKIMFAREGWTKANLDTKIQVAVMEFWLSMGQEGRYKMAEIVGRALAKKLILTDGNIQFPKSTDRALETALKLLNEPGNETRRFVILNLTSFCHSTESDCQKWYEGLPDVNKPEESKAQFTEDDILSVTYIGEGWMEDGCKLECDESNYYRDIRTFQITLKARVDLRWSNTPASIVLNLNYIKKTGITNGRVADEVHLVPFGQIFPPEEIEKL